MQIIPPAPSAPSLKDLRELAPGATLDDVVHVATICAMHLELAGWERLPDGRWTNPHGGGSASFPVAVDLHLRKVGARISAGDPAGEK